LLCVGGARNSGIIVVSGALMASPMPGLVTQVLDIRQMCRALVVTGPIGSGKTQAAMALAEGLRGQGLTVGGVVSPRVFEGGLTVGYRVRDLATGEEQTLCTEEPPGIRFRRFYFCPRGLEFANEAVRRASRWANLVVVDEVGPLELAGNGLAPGLVRALDSGVFVVMCVRPWLVDDALLWAGFDLDTPVWEVPGP